jgi:pimeloyl-ACP methyl ester carboxylesterase
VRPGSRRYGALCVVAGACVACSGPKVPKPDQHAVAQFEAQGYMSPRHDAIRSYTIDWNEAEQSRQFELVLPEHADRAPLIVYLPGLGQDQQAGVRWTQAWAQAGYAVISIQPLADDELAWSSEDARSGKFDAVARHGFSEATMRRRLPALNDALEQLAHRAAAGDPLLRPLDFSRMAVVGFDLGAYSAMVIAGQGLEATERPLLSMPVRAVIALSPFADASATGHRERYAAISGPVLNITGAQDVDAYGLIDSASLRTQPFRLMPPGDKYLVSLALGSHGLIGGADPTPRVAEEPRVRTRARKDRGDEPSSQKRGHGRDSTAGNEDSVAADSDDEPVVAPPENTGPARSELLTRQAMSSVSVRIITTAFLDAYVRGEPVARSWLNDRARQWLAPNASLVIR